MKDARGGQGLPRHVDRKTTEYQIREIAAPTIRDLPRIPRGRSAVWIAKDSHLHGQARILRTRCRSAIREGNCCSTREALIRLKPAQFSPLSRQNGGRVEALHRVAISKRKPAEILLVVLPGTAEIPNHYREEIGSVGVGPHHHIETVKTITGVVSGKRGIPEIAEISGRQKDVADLLLRSAINLMILDIRLP